MINFSVTIENRSYLYKSNYWGHQDAQLHQETLRKDIHNER